MAKMYPGSPEKACGKGWEVDDPTPGEARFFLFARGQSAGTWTRKERFLGLSPEIRAFRTRVPRTGAL